MTIIRLTFFILFFSNIVNAQNNIEQLTHIPVSVTSNHEIIYQHTLKKSETLFSLAKLFRIPLQDLMLINNISKDQTLPLNTEIIVPVNPDRIIISAVKSNENWIPILYKVKKKETLYRISKGYFNQNIQQLMGRNNLTKLSLNLGQKLIVGWWSTENVTINKPTSKPIFNSLISSTPEISNSSEDSLIISNNLDSLTLFKNIANIDQSIDTTLNSNDTLIDSETLLPKILNNKGIAIWERSDPNDDFLFVLHKSAKVGSVIKLQHPVTNKIVVAEVVDKLPQDTYSKDVDLIISKAVAEKLGALETRFQVGMTYYE